MSTTIGKSLIDLIQKMPDAIIVTNKTGIIEIVNDKAYEVFGYSPEELIGKEIEVLVPVASREKHKKYVHEYFTNPQDKKMAAHRKVLGLKKNGTEFEIDITLAALYTDNKIYAISSSRNISDKKHLEEELQIENVSLHLTNKELSKYGYTVSHDLKAPLAKIEGLLGLLCDEIKQGKKFEELDILFKYITDSVDSMRTIITDILQDAQRKNNENEQELLVLPETFKEIKKLITIPENFKIDIQCTQSITIYGKKIQLIQVFLNLLSNSIKFNDKKEGIITISCEDREKEIKFIFSDNGPGIPSNKINNIFDLFVKGANNPQSHGIGLHTVKSIIEARKGKISVSNKAEGGALFEFTWPKHNTER